MIATMSIFALPSNALRTPFALEIATFGRSSNSLRTAFERPSNALRTCFTLTPPYPPGAYAHARAWRSHPSNETGRSFDEVAA